MKKLLTILTGLLLLLSVDGQILRYNNYVAPLAEGNGLKTNLVVYLPLDETSGTYIDAHSSNDATDHGELWGSESNGKLGNAIIVTAGTTDYLSMTEVADLQMVNSDISVSFWMYANSIQSSGTRGIIGAEDTGFKVDYLAVTGKLRIGATANAPDGPAVAISGWHHVVITYSDASATNNIVYYLDGNATTVSKDINVAANKGTIYIGANNDWQNIKTLFDGLIDEVAIYKGRVLSADNVAVLYNDGNGLPYSNFD